MLNVKKIFRLGTMLTVLLLATAARGQSELVREKLYFNLNSAELQPAEQKKLKSFIDANPQLKTHKVLLYGYADFLGSKQFNDSISLARSLAVKRFLVKNGVPVQNIPITLGKGSSGAPGADAGAIPRYLPLVSGKRRLFNKHSSQGDRGNPEDRRVEIITDEDFIAGNTTAHATHARKMQMQEDLDGFRTVMPKDEQYYPKVTLNPNASKTQLDNGDVFEGVLDAHGHKTGIGRYKYANDEEYVGTFKNDKRNGEGTYMWPNGDYVRGRWVDDEVQDGVVVVNTKRGDIKGEESLDGTFDNGKPIGHARHTFADGSGYDADYESSGAIKDNILTYDDGTYKGSLKSQVPHGKGTYTYSNGDVYDGEFANGKKNGHGRKTWASGDVYDGGWNNDQRSGEGTLTKTNHLTYKGAWKDNMPEGQGKMVYPNGTVYDGNWVGNKHSGHGRLTMADGETYDGEFVDGKYNGHGILHTADSGRYEGDFKNDKMDGIGTYTFPDGLVFAGEFKNDNKDGHGILKKNDGTTIYDGGWKNEVRQGKGKRIYGNGDTYTGDWNADQREGHGTYATHKGDSTVGSWTANVRQGHHKVRYSDGSAYEGEYEQDKRKGKWVLTRPDGSTEEHLWQAGVRQQLENTTDRTPDPLEIHIARETVNPSAAPAPQTAAGETKDESTKDNRGFETRVETYPNGDAYAGGMMNRQRAAHGKYDFGNGDEFVGGWDKGKRDGPGRYTYKDGSFYQGSYKEGLKDGKGIFTDNDGNTDEQVWDHGKKVTSSNPSVFIPSEADVFGESEGDASKAARAQHKIYANGDSYTGAVTGEQRDGHGVYNATNNDRFEGEFSNNKRNGLGRYTYADGSYYVGNYKNGLKDGVGSFADKNGQEEKQTWKDGKPVSSNIAMNLFYRDEVPLFGELPETAHTAHDPYTTKTYPNGDTYKGETAGENRSGHGTYNATNHDSFDGDFTGNKRNGHGIYRYADGSTYDGTYANGLKDGPGIFTDPAGHRQAQDWRSGVPLTDVKSNPVYKDEVQLFGELLETAKSTHTAYAKKTYANGDTYTGEVVGERRSGHGKYVATNGDTFEGEWFDNKRNGRGVYTFADGSVYDADYVAGYKSGKGTYRNGVTHDVEDLNWVNGSPEHRKRSIGNVNLPEEHEIVDEHPPLPGKTPKPKTPEVANKAKLKRKWAPENLNVDHFRDGTPIREARSRAEWDKCNREERPCWCYYDNNPANGITHGKLYNWWAVNDP